MPSMLSIGLCLICVLGATVPCRSQSSEARADVSSVEGTQATEERPDYRLDRADEDWSSLCKQPARGGDSWDRFKCIPLGRSSYVSFGGEIRGSYERYSNYN